jgi:hypothetical protein
MFYFFYFESASNRDMCEMKGKKSDYLFNKKVFMNNAVNSIKKCDAIKIGLNAFGNLLLSR